MNPNIKRAFSSVKPLCDAIMVDPSPETLNTFLTVIKKIRKETVQEMQLYILFPLVNHLKSAELSKKHELHRNLVDAMKTILEMVTVTTPEIFVKYHNCLLALIFDKNQPGMVAQVPEELKLSVTRCLTTLMHQVADNIRVDLLKLHTPLLAQSIYIIVHIAKFDKLRVLRLSAIKCVMTLTGAKRPFLDKDYKISDPNLEAAVTDMVASILPGILSALQDIATSTDNTGHAVTVAALRATHCLVCLVMNDKYLHYSDNASTSDFVKMFKEKLKVHDKNRKEVSKMEIPAKHLRKKTPEWFVMAGDKLKLVTRSMLPLQTHENLKVRKELALYCSRVLSECSRTMQPSLPYILDILIALVRDDSKDVSDICYKQLSDYFRNCNDYKLRTLDCLADNFQATLGSMPRILNSVDFDRKLATLNLLNGYLAVMCNEDRPQPLTRILTIHKTLENLCLTLIEAAKLDTAVSLLEKTHFIELEAPAYDSAPWRKLTHLREWHLERVLRDICGVLGAAECVDLIADRLLAAVTDSHDDRKEAVYLLNHIVSAKSTDATLKRRILDAYIDPELWYLPIDVASGDLPATSEETLDLTVYNPRAWDKDSVPGLYEGTVETRYTDISYRSPRVPPTRDPRFCANLAEARANLVLACLLTEGVGILADALGEQFQAYLLKTLCMVLERVGSKYELLHMSGTLAIHMVARACGCQDVTELINTNADYFTYQITMKLKKSWDSESALRILHVVMERSDTKVLDCLYGIVSDVLVQSCDKYHGNDLSAYLQVFLTFVTRIPKWYPDNEEHPENSDPPDVLADTINYIQNKETSEILLESEQFEKESGKSVEDMYREDLRSREEDVSDYHDQVTEEKPPLPQHIKITATILKRCVNFVPSKRRDEKLLALQVINRGLMVLRQYEDELLPLVHSAWGPLVGRFGDEDPALMRRALELFVTMATVSKDFIRSRALKEVLSKLYKFLDQSSEDSHLKDAGSAYRSSHAYRLQQAALESLPTLVVDLQLEDTDLERAMDCMDHYLSNKQPKPLQVLAVKFFKVLLEYDWGAAWHHLRLLCDNQNVLEPPSHCVFALTTVLGTPFEPKDSKYANNINLIFDVK